ncbi:helix-turn-helix transcriptional regulator [Phytohabitans rumicis]|uniref:AraC family transcriptional regulator n=1 Tax=Phytohabitans rumicis TaxID=1076125 RepID=A0A6V8KTT7_9ACTN|nr:AraC family transcriptional regulator [Phytohabitans rumicis]GFJ86860.1 AraC family transcriptional regulator [Phytohabitans rumicis]
MHRVQRAEVFSAVAVAVAAERFDRLPETTAHSHDFIELAVVTHGTATHRAASGVRRLRRGSVILLRPGDWHGYEDCRGLSVSNLYVAPEVFRRELAWVREEPQLARLAGAAGAPDDQPWQLPAGVLETVESALPEMAGGAPGPRYAMRLGLLLCVLGAVAATDPGHDREAAPVHRAYPAALAAAGLLEEDVATQWTLGALAAAVHVSSTHLARQFTAQLGTSPIAYLGRLRAERAAALLIETDLPVATIGRMVGWPDPNYASRRFRQYFGHSPATYRRLFGSSAEPSNSAV